MKKFPETGSLWQVVVVCTILFGFIGVSLASDLTFKEIYKNYKGMSKSQFGRYAESLTGTQTGTHVIWTGEVKGVEPREFGGYKVIIQRGKKRQVVLNFEINDFQNPEIQELKKRQKVKFQGEISRIRSASGTVTVHLDNVFLLD